MRVHIKNRIGGRGIDIIALHGETNPDTSDGSIVMDYADLKYDTHWENAYTLVDGKIVIDISAVRMDLIGRIRSERTALFAPLDLEFMRALESDDPSIKAGVIARKNQLRNITEHPLLTTVTDPEKLRHVNVNMLLNTQVDASGNLVGSSFPTEEDKLRRRQLASITDLSGNSL